MKIAALVFLAATGASASPVDLRLADGLRVHIEEAACGSAADCRTGSLRFLGAEGRAKHYISAITVATGSRSYALDASDMIDPLLGGPPSRPWKNFGGFCYDERNCSFRGVFGDGGGSYVAEWQIIEGKSIRTVLSGSGDLVQFFLEHLTPPRYE